MSEIVRFPTRRARKPSPDPAFDHRRDVLLRALKATNQIDRFRSLAIELGHGDFAPDDPEAAVQKLAALILLLGSDIAAVRGLPPSTGFSAGTVPRPPTAKKHRRPEPARHTQEDSAEKILRLLGHAIAYQIIAKQRAAAKPAPRLSLVPAMDDVPDTPA